MFGINSRTVKIFLFCYSLIFLMTAGFFVYAQENTVSGVLAAGTVNTASEGDYSKVAPGDFLPISVKLLNFGSQKRVDVVIHYKIFDTKNKEVYSENETVAVETTASFIKRIQLPDSIGPGSYTVQTELNYPYQSQPAVSSFHIVVERKIGTFFESDLIAYSVVIVPIVLIVFISIVLISKWKQKHVISAHDYSDKPKDQILYYEILDDIIHQMRLRAGDDALEIAKKIPFLAINEKNGLVINISKDPAQVVASLISQYEKSFGRKVSFSLRKSK